MSTILIVLLNFFQSSIRIRTNPDHFIGFLRLSHVENSALMVYFNNSAVSTAQVIFKGMNFYLLKRKNLYVCVLPEIQPCDDINHIRNNRCLLYLHRLMQMERPWRELPQEQISASLRPNVGSPHKPLRGLHKLMQTRKTSFISFIK